MSRHTAAATSTHKRRRIWIIRALGILVVLLVILKVAAPWIEAYARLLDTAINSLLASPSGTASSCSASIGCFSSLFMSAILLAALIVVAPRIVAHTRFRDRAINSILASPSVTASSDSAAFGWFSPLEVSPEAHGPTGEESNYLCRLSRKWSQMIAQLSEDLVWSQIVARAWCDEDFMNRLLSDPRSVLAEHDLEVPLGTQVEVVPFT